MHVRVSIICEINFPVVCRLTAPPPAPPNTRKCFHAFDCYYDFVFLSYLRIFIHWLLLVLMLVKCRKAHVYLVRLFFVLYDLQELNFLGIFSSLLYMSFISDVGWNYTHVGCEPALVSALDREIVFSCHYYIILTWNLIYFTIRFKNSAKFPSLFAKQLHKIFNS